MLLECKNVSMKYEGVIAVNKVSFTVDEGDFLCVVGENGSGKSTLVKGILGLRPLFGGEINFNGIKQNEIGYLPQQTIVQKDFPATVREVIMSGCLNRCGFRPFYTAAEKKRSENAAREMGITGIMKKSYRELSGGQQQRVLLARALCAAEKLLLLDEPVTGLDPAATAEMYGLINDLNKNGGVTIIMISHDLRSAAAYGNKILHISADNTFFGSVEEYMNTEIFKRLTKG